MPILNLNLKSGYLAVNDFNSDSETWLKKITLSPFGQIVLYELIQSEISATLPFEGFSIGRCKERALIFRFET